MKRIAYIALFVLAIVVVSCRTTEENYRKAYEAAVVAREDAADEDKTIYTQIRREMKQGAVEVDGKEVPVNSQMVALTDGGGGTPEMLRRFCVVAGQFKLEFNAKKMRERLVEEGYPEAFVVQTREPYFFVVAASYDDAKSATAMLERLRSDASLQIKAPLPFILDPIKKK